MRKTWVILIQALTLQAIQICDAEEQKFEFIAENSRFTSEEHFLLSIRSAPNTWFRIDASSNLEDWEELINMRELSGATAYFDETSSRFGSRFYRLSGIPTTIAGSRSVWLSRSIQHYRFHLERGVYDSPVLGGESVTVTVEGEDISVGDYSASGGVVFDINNIPDMGGLFDLLSAAEASGARSMHVAYDPEYGFPTRIWIDHNPYRDALEGFVITDFEILSEQ